MPRANGKHGFVRIDMTHRSIRINNNGVYHLNAVDEASQFKVLCTIEKINEQYFIPTIVQLLDCFTFGFQGFHSDNDPEYIDYKV